MPLSVAEELVSKFKMADKDESMFLDFTEFHQVNHKQRNHVIRMMIIVIM